MKLAFCLFRYFPYGGLQRDFFRIAGECLRRGHEVHVYVSGWEGKTLPGARIITVPVTGTTNHGRSADFAAKVQTLLSEGRYDAVVGFNKMSGLDLYYAADPCFQARAKSRGWFGRWLPRYRIYSALERTVFAKDALTKILLISPAEKVLFQSCYGTPDERFHLLPPGIARDRIAPDDVSSIRSSVRGKLGVGESEVMLLLIGSAFRTKGVDRAIRALASLPDDLRRSTRLVVVGRDSADSFQRLANRLQVGDRVLFLGGRDDVPQLMFSADLLIHPARTENTGTVLLEALAAGLPVLASAVCGYGHHVIAAEAGLLIPEPFSQARLDGMLLNFLRRPDRQDLARKASAYAFQADLYSMIEKAADLIEVTARAKDV